MKPDERPEPEPKFGLGSAIGLIAIGAGLSYYIYQGEGLKRAKQEPTAIPAKNPQVPTGLDLTNPPAHTTDPTQTAPVAKPDPTKPDTTTKPDPKPGAKPGEKPANPFNGAIMPSPIPGGLPSATTTTPVENPKPTTVQFVSCSIDGSISGAIKAAQTLGGKAHPFKEWIKPGVVADAALVTVPTAKLQDFLKTSGLHVAEDWQGETGERLSRMERPYRTAQSDFRKKRDDLLVRYLPTAPAIVNLDEDLASIGSTIKALESFSMPADQVAIKISSRD